VHQQRSLPAPQPGAWRARTALWLERPRIQKILIALILLNAGILGMETSPALMRDYGVWLTLVDQAILWVFVVEIGLRLAVHRMAFFRDPWSVFDFLVVGIALVPASGPFAVLRALRVLRVLRLLTVVPSMRRVVAGLLSAIPGLISVMAVIALIFYVGAVVSTKLFSAAYPDWFGSLGASAYTLFQVMTLESWSMGIVRPVMQTHPYAWAFFIPFIMVSTFTMLNLFIAVIVNAIQSTHIGEDGNAVAPSQAVPDDAQEALLRNQIGALQQEIADLKDLVQQALRKT